MADYSGAISLSHARDFSHTSDEEDDEHSPRSVPPLAGSAGGGSSKSRINSRGGGGEMGSTVEMSRKPRGRPPGSKNKPKPPIVITRDSESAMKPVVLEISAGSDIVEMVSQFASRRHVRLSVISGTGTVSNVTLRHPVSHAPTLSLHGPFHILSLSGTFMGSSATTSSSSFAISLAGAQGQVFGGIVAGKVIAASQVVLVAATFLNPTFHRLPIETEEAEETKPNIGGHGGGGGAGESCTSASMSMSVYSVAAPTPLNCQISPDVMPWGPTSRPSPY